MSFRFQFGASSYITGLNWTSELKVIVVCICSEFSFSTMSVWIYYGTQSNIRAKSYCRLHLLRASIFNFEPLNILLDSIGHPSLKQLSFEFATSFRFQFRASRYITGLNRISESKVIVVWIGYELLFSIPSILKNVIVVCIWSQLLFSILSVLIYYGTQSDIWVKIYCRLNLLRASVFNFKRLDILRDLIGHPSSMLLSFKFGESSYIQFWASRIIKWLNWTSE